MIMYALPGEIDSLTTDESFALLEFPFVAEIPIANTITAIIYFASLTIDSIFSVFDSFEPKNEAQIPKHSDNFKIELYLNKFIRHSLTLNTQYCANY